MISVSAMSADCVPGGTYQRAMPERELSNAAGHHVHQDLLIKNYCGRGINKTGFHT